jgi:enoyl-CoA hydratase
MQRCPDAAADIRGNSPFGTWMTKEVLWANLEIPSLSAGIDIENRNQILASFTEDSREAMGAMLARRSVDWRNR